MRARAHAKLNLALAVYPPTADGYHPLRGIFQSVSLADDVTLDPGSADAITVSNDEAPADETNLAWRALDEVRRAARLTQPATLAITKRIPAGAGLGGGSADAAATLGMAAERFGVDLETVSEIAEGLGADVPFALVGGTCLVEGRGERLTPMLPLEGFGMAIVVPPFTMATPDVYRMWDRLDGPQGEAIPDADLPPPLRGGLPMRNDLFPAAIALDQRVGDWASDLAAAWGVRVSMTGSGSALFAYFPTSEEAADAARSITLPTRIAVGVATVPRGWAPVDG